MIEVFWSTKLLSPLKDKLETFMNQMSKRLLQGHARYGGPARRQMYMTRMEMEVKKYRETGNREYLLNVANYAFLESVSPEHERHYHDNGTNSATRKELGT